MYIPSLKIIFIAGTSLVVQRLRLCTSTAGTAGSIPGRGTKIPHTVWCGQKVKRKKIILLLKNANHHLNLQQAVIFLLVEGLASMSMAAD